MKENDTDLKRLLSAYRISKLQILSYELRPSKRVRPGKIYYTHLAAGIRYVAALQKENQHIEAEKILDDLLAHIEKAPVKPIKSGKNKGFLKDIESFGTMEHGVV